MINENGIAYADLWNLIQDLIQRNKVKNTNQELQDMLNDIPEYTTTSDDNKKL